MTGDPSLFPMPVPTQAVTQRSLGETMQAFRPGFGEYLGASGREGFWTKLAGQAMAAGSRDNAQFFAEQGGSPDAQRLEEADWKVGAYFRDKLKYSPGLTVAQARAQAEIFDQNQYRAWLIDRRQAGFFGQVAGFAAGVLGSLPTPENFLPIAGPALAAARAGWVGTRLATAAQGVATATTGRVGQRAAAGAGMGAVDGAVGSAVTMPLVVAGRENFGDDVTWGEIILDLAMGGAAGGLLGAAGGALLGRNTNRPFVPTVAQQDAALNALAKASDDLAQGRAPDLSSLPVSTRLTLQQLQREAAEAAAEIARLRDQVGTGTGSNVAATAAARVQGGAALPELVAGKPTVATTPAGTDVQVRYEVVDLGQLVASNAPDGSVNPAFPAELQPRDRSRPESIAWVQQNAARLRPEELAVNNLAGTGAPIVGPDGTVESGNGRVLLLTEAYGKQLPTAPAYRAYIEGLGFKTEGLAQPVLIRRRLTEMDPAARRKFTAEANADITARLTASEQAGIDARRLDARVLGLFRGGELDAAGNGPFVRAFIETLPQSEQGALSSGGALTRAGQERLRGALASRAYGDPDLVRVLTETPDATLEGVGKALIDAAPDVARLRAAIEAGQVNPDMDALSSLVNAVRRIQDARRADQPLDGLLAQMDMLGGGPTPAQRVWLGLMLRPNRQGALGTASRQQIADRLAAFVRHATEAPTTADMMGNPPPNVRDVLAATYREAGLDPPPELRAMEPETAAPRDPIEKAAEEPLPEPPPPIGTPDPMHGAARAMGFDLADVATLDAALDRARQAGRLSDEDAASVREAAQLVAKTERAVEAHQAAATCALEA